MLSSRDHQPHHSGRKRIVFYSQHLIGVGHHFRNREIVRALSQNHQVYFVDGGRQISGGDLPDSVERIQISPVFASAEGLSSDEPSRDIQGVLRERCDVLCKAIENIDPDIFMIEFFPFGRRRLRSELISAIESARSTNPDVKVVCSLRDIPMRAKTADFVGPPMPDALAITGKLRFYSVPFGGPQYVHTLMARQYYNEVCPTLNTHFDALLVHGDPKVTRLEEHFPWVEDIEIPIEYTGYVSEKLKSQRLKNGLPKRFVLVSAGGGAEAYELIVPCIETWKLLLKQGITQGREMVIFTGPFVRDDQFESLKQMCDGGPFRLSRFAPDFLSWMQAADFSISRAGYNTCMNVLETGTPTLLVPSVPMGDQVFRAEKLSELGLADVIASEDLSLDSVADVIIKGISRPPASHNIALDGANKTVDFVSKLSTRSRKMVCMDFDFKIKDEMKICMIAHQYPPVSGGVGVATQRIARNLARCGVSVHVIAPGPHRIGDAISVSHEDGVEVHRMYPALSHYYGEQWELQDIGTYVVQLHEKEHFDIIHGLFLSPSGLVAANVSAEIDRPFVASIRGNDWETMRYSPLLAASSRWVLERADLATSVSSALLEKAQKTVHIMHGKVIPNAFDSSLFDHRPLKEIGSQQVRQFLKVKGIDRLVVGTVAMIRHKKGHRVLFEAFRVLLDKFSDAVLLMVGDYHSEQDRMAFTQQIEELGLEDRLFITGEVPHTQVLAWLKEMDIFAYPSLYEGSPNALLEAMACGLPVVGSQVDGISDLITDGEDGILISAGCVDKLAETLILLAKDQGLRDQLGSAAQQMVGQQLMPVHEAKIWVDTYNLVIASYQKQVGKTTGVV